MTRCPGCLRLGFFDPLTHGSFGHAEGGSSVFLFPPLFIQLLAAQSSAFAPIFRKRFFLAHTSFHRLTSFTALGPHAEVSNVICQQYLERACGRPLTRSKNQRAAGAEEAAIIHTFL